MIRMEQQAAEKTMPPSTKDSSDLGEENRIAFNIWEKQRIEYMNNSQHLNKTL